MANQLFVIYKILWICELPTKEQMGCELAQSWSWHIMKYKEKFKH